MLFFLSEELIADEYYQDPRRQDKINRAVKNILLGVFESKHLMCANLNVLTFFTEKITDHDALSTLRDIINKYSFINYTSIKRRIKVIPQDNIHELIQDGDYKIINLSINYFQDSKMIQPTIILGEDTQDTDFYYIISKFICKKYNYNLNLCYDSDNGGGSSISDRYKRFQNKNERFCLAFVDTDKHFPEDDEGGTLKELRNTANLNNHMCQYMVIDVQEIENLVPFNYIADIPALSQDDLNAINYIQINNPELLRFYDLKKGIKKKTICLHPNVEKFKEYARQVCISNPNIIDFEEYYIAKNDDDLVYNQLCRILKFTIGALTEMKKEPVLLDFQEEEWLRIGNEFFFWACARSQEALNI